MDYLHIWLGHWLGEGHETNRKWKCFDQRWPTVAILEWENWENLLRFWLQGTPEAAQ